MADPDSLGFNYYRIRSLENENKILYFNIIIIIVYIINNMVHTEFSNYYRELRLGNRNSIILALIQFIFSLNSC